MRKLRLLCIQTHPANNRGTATFADGKWKQKHRDPYADTQEDPGAPHYTKDFQTNRHTQRYGATCVESIYRAFTNSETALFTEGFTYWTRTCSHLFLIPEFTCTNTREYFSKRPRSQLAPGDSASLKETCSSCPNTPFGLLPTRLRPLALRRVDRQDKGSEASLVPRAVLLPFPFSLGRWCF